MLMKGVSRSSITAAIITLAFASISATSVFAMGLVPRNAHIVDQKLASQWKEQLIDLKVEKFLGSNIMKWDTKWMQTKPSHYKRVKESKFATIIAFNFQQAENIVTKHAGFDPKGKVIDKAQATKTIQRLELYLHQFHMELMDRLLPRFRKI